MYFHDQLRTIAERSTHDSAFNNLGDEAPTAVDLGVLRVPTQSSCTVFQVIDGLSDVARTFSPIALLFAASSLFSQHFPGFNPARHILPSLISAGLSQSSLMDASNQNPIDPYAPPSPRPAETHSRHEQPQENRKHTRAYQLIELVKRHLQNENFERALRSLTRLSKIGIDFHIQSEFFPALLECAQQMEFALRSPKINESQRNAIRTYLDAFLADAEASHV